MSSKDFIDRDRNALVILLRDGSSQKNVLFMASNLFGEVFRGSFLLADCYLCVKCLAADLASCPELSVFKFFMRVDSFG